ncbi:serine/threonine-protein kinase [Actinomadura sediminis]|uniref:non-specific serine/threonine protein kinase n=1 Tax=Actinomadura sediminis TaxID=1038904 RepID=A0ABW3EYP8_9ACTN
MAGRLLAGRYRLLSVVGRGGMGTVWRAVDETLDREVAVKEVVLPHGLADDERENRHRRTLREARASARLGHPGVVTVHDVVDEDGRPWIVMELVRGRSLQDIIDADGPLDPGRAAAIGRQVVGALRAAHAIGILHRDVKPANVLVTADDRAVLTDFGIAQVAGDATLTGTGMVMGSPAYMSPERVKGDAALPASDLWALGATLYAACEGKAPHHRSDAMAVLAAVMTQDAPPPRNAGPLAPVLVGLLERDPAVRTNAQQAEEALAAIADGRAASLAAAAAGGTALDGTALDGTAVDRTTVDRTAAGHAAGGTAADAGAPIPGPIPVPDPPGRTGTIRLPADPDARPHPHVAGTARQQAGNGTGGGQAGNGRGGRARTPLIFAAALAAAAVAAAGAFFLWPARPAPGPKPARHDRRRRIRTARPAPPARRRRPGPDSRTGRRAGRRAGRRRRSPVPRTRPPRPSSRRTSSAPRAPATRSASRGPGYASSTAAASCGPTPRPADTSRWTPRPGTATPTGTGRSGSSRPRPTATCAPTSGFPSSAAGSPGTPPPTSSSPGSAPGRRPGPATAESSSTAGRMRSLSRFRPPGGTRTRLS